MPADPLWNGLAQLAIGAAVVVALLAIGLMFINPRERDD